MDATERGKPQSDRLAATGDAGVSSRNWVPIPG